jgi:hypothetical protein
MNGFRKLQERLSEEGWYVGWAELCCQTCAWGTLPDTLPNGNDVDYSKVLFNHEQDCENDEWMEALDDEALDDYEYEGEGTMETFSPEEQNNSTFCFDGSEEGVANLRSIIPIIEECGCEIYWNGEGDQRPDISWKL